MRGWQDLWGVTRCREAGGKQRNGGESLRQAELPADMSPKLSLLVLMPVHGPGTLWLRSPRVPGLPAQVRRAQLERGAFQCTEESPRLTISLSALFWFSFVLLFLLFFLSAEWWWVHGSWVSGLWIPSYMQPETQTYVPTLYHPPAVRRRLPFCRARREERGGSPDSRDTVGPRERPGENSNLVRG